MFNWIVPRNRNYNNRVAKCQHYRASWSCGLNVWTCNWTELRSYSERVQEDLNLAWCMMNFSENRWKLNAVCSRHSPTGQQGSGALLAGGWVAREALVNCPTRWSLLLLIGYWCRSSSWRWQPHIRGCRLHYPLPRAEMRFLVQFFSKMYLLYVSIWWKNWKQHFFAIFNPSKTQFSWTLWDHLATFPDLRFHLAGTSNPEK